MKHPRHTYGGFVSATSEWGMTTSKPPNSDPGWCFKFRAENCGISLGHTFGPIELKIGVLPI
jgi:hypothetical protein